jgi:hypothetical protein
MNYAHSPLFRPHPLLAAFEVHPLVRQLATGQLSIGWLLLAKEEDLVAE